MALSKTEETPFGVTIPDAYLRVENVTLESKTRMSFRVRGYSTPAANKAAFSDRGYTCTYSMEGSDPFEQAYLHLKTLSDFSTARDA